MGANNLMVASAVFPSSSVTMVGDNVASAGRGTSPSHVAVVNVAVLLTYDTHVLPLIFVQK
jgi:hypothetical protein